MLRISRHETRDGVVLKLAGKLLEPWLAELHEAAGDAAGRIGLDLSSLSFADAAGINTLREMTARGARVVASSGYIAALLRVENS